MGSTKVAVAAVGLACVVAAGAGGYFALRQNAAQEPASATASTPVTTTTAEIREAPPASATPVQETEAVVAPKETNGARATKKPDVKAPKPASQTAAAVPPRSTVPLQATPPPVQAPEPVAVPPART